MKTLKEVIPVNEGKNIKNYETEEVTTDQRVSENSQTQKQAENVARGKYC